MLLDTISELALSLFENICVIVVFAYLITRTRYFSEVLDKKFTLKNQIILTIIFGAISIFGTYSGIEILGAIANVRDLGPMIAGLACGPFVGIGAGLIGAIHRLSLGGFTCVACSLATFFAGLFGSIIYKLRKGGFVGTSYAVLFAALLELFHMGLALLLSQPFSTALAVVESVIVPMVLANSIGMSVFSLFTTNLIKERKTKEERDRYQKESTEKEIRIRELEIDKLKRYSKELENRVKNLEIRIDEERARKAVADITETEYFQKLKNQATTIRKGKTTNV